LNRFKLMLPVQSPLAKIFLFSFGANHLFILAIPAQQKGAFHDRHERRAGDAMDGDTPLTNGVDPNGEVVWS
jgi:hypothetical protein